MKRFLEITCALALALCVALPVAAQPGTTATLTAPDSDSRTTAEVLDSLLGELESQLQGGASTGYHPQNNPYGFAPGERPRYSAAVVEERLQRLNFVVPMDYNPVIQSYIDIYTTKYPHALAKLMGLAQVYFPIIEEIFEREGVPQEIKYLCIVESAMNPYARSWAGAVGLWQFMHGTARLYNMRVDSYIDERHDPVKSTQAAARYLRDLYNMYGNWHMALAAYNCGPGRLNRAIRAAGGATSYWELTEYLPRETRGYVPAFIGAAYAMSYAAEYNITPTPANFSFLQDSIMVIRQRLDLRTLARETNTDFNLLAKLNPELRLGVVPYAERPYALRVPQATALAVQNRRSGESQTAQVGQVASNNAPPGTHLVYHTLGQNERIAQVAEQYRVSSSDIIRWNNLQGYEARPGLRLKIYAPLSSSDFAPQRSNPNAQPAATQRTQPATPQANSQPAGGAAAYYTVRSGDSLWGIANANNLSVDELCRLNNLSRDTRLQVGARLRVR